MQFFGEKLLFESFITCNDVFGFIFFNLIFKSLKKKTNTKQQNMVLLPEKVGVTLIFMYSVSGTT